MSNVQGSRSNLVAKLAMLTGIAGIATGLLATRNAVHDGKRSEAELAALKEQLNEVAARPAPTTLLVAGTAQPHPGDRLRAAIPDVTTSPEPRHELSSEEREYRDERLRVAQEEANATSFATEIIDSAWATEASRKLGSLLSPKDYPDVQVTATCKSSLCKVDIGFAEASLGEGALRAIALTPPWSAAAWARFDLEHKRGTVYLAREGHDLPEVSPESVVF